MNDYHMISLAHDRTAELQAEAARSRLAHAARTEPAGPRPGPRVHDRLTGPRASLATLLQRVSLS